MFAFDLNQNFCLIQDNFFHCYILKLVLNHSIVIFLLLQEPLNVISGPKAFNSGKPTADNSFLYTFDEPGSYTVASQGAPGYSCIVFVLAAGMLKLRLID